MPQHGDIRLWLQFSGFGGVGVAGLWLEREGEKERMNGIEESGSEEINSIYVRSLARARARCTYVRSLRAIASYRDIYQRSSFDRRSNFIRN